MTRRKTSSVADPGELESPEGVSEQRTAATNSVDQATALLADQGENERRANAESEERNFEVYAKLLLRSDDPLPNDAQELAWMMQDLFISPETMREDRRMVLRAVELTRLHGQLAEAQDAFTAINEATVPMLKRHEAEAREHDRKKAELTSHFTACSRAAAELRLLADRRPYFFDTSIPPRLRPVDAVSQG